MRMTVCDRCKEMDKKTIIVWGKIQSSPTMGPNGNGYEFRRDFCESCLNAILYAIGIEQIEHTPTAEGTRE